MPNYDKTTIALLISLALLAPVEWGRVKEWYLFLSPVKQVVVGVLMAIFSMIILAVVVQPFLWDLFQHML